MANTKTTALTELASGGQADGDFAPIVDVSDTTQGAGGTLKKFAWSSIKAGLKTYFDTLYAAVGAIGSSGLTQSTGKLLGRSTAGTGSVEEITVGSGLTLSAGTLTAAGGTPGGSTTQVQYNLAGAFVGDAGMTYAGGLLAVNYLEASVAAGSPIFRAIGNNATAFVITASSSGDYARSMNIIGAPASYAGYGIVGGDINITAGAGNSSPGTGACSGGAINLNGGTPSGTGVKGAVTASRFTAIGLATAIVSKTASYTATLDDGTIQVDATSGAATITLFAASGNAGKILCIKKVDSSGNAVTVDGNASETIDGATTVTLATQYATCLIQVNAAGTGWNKLAAI